MHKLNLITGILALSLFGYAQMQGWSMFDSVANTSGHSSSGGSRVYHK